MKIFIDNALIRRMRSASTNIEKGLEVACQKAGIPLQEYDFALSWPALLELIELGHLYDTLPVFHERNIFFNALCSALSVNATSERILDLYDQIFAECLTEIKNLPEVQYSFLVNRINEKLNSVILLQPKLHLALASCEKLLIEEPYNALHDLILYLAWDRMCINIACIFDQYPSKETKIQGFEVLISALIESFQHITQHARTKPGFFRLVETMYAFQMREENLEIHTEAEWLLLCQCSKALMAREQLIDLYYVDAALINAQNRSETLPLKIFTLYSRCHVQSVLALAEYANNKMKNYRPEWPFQLGSIDIINLTEENGEFSVN